VDFVNDFTIYWWSGGHLDPLDIHKQFSSLNFLCHFQIYIAVGAFSLNSLINARCTALFDCVWAINSNR